jgi:predicted dehydrogenase
MKRKLKVGVIGVGGIAQARHIPHLRNNASVNLVALCDIKYAGSYVLYYHSIPKL